MNNNSTDYRQLLPRPAGLVTHSDEPARKKDAKAKAACLTCRARKTKCDTQRPDCGACILRGAKCDYDIAPGVSRYTSLKRKHENLEQEHTDLLELFDMLKHRSENDALSILQRIRLGSDLQSILWFVKEGDLLVQARTITTGTHNGATSQAASPTEAYLNLYHENAYPTLGPLNEDAAKELGQKPGTVMEIVSAEKLLSKEEEEGIYDPRSIRRRHHQSDERIHRISASRWTDVTVDDAIISNLVSVYLSWEHSSFRIFDEDQFLDDLVEGKTDYCSSLLLNAICAVATLNYTGIDAEAAELSTAFFKETKRLWRVEEGQSDLLHVPASILLCLWCNANCKDRLGALYLSQGIQIAKDLGLFRATNRPSEDVSSHTLKGRGLIAWGIFNFQAVQSYVLRQGSSFSRPPTFPIVHGTGGSKGDYGIWQPYPLLCPEQMHDRGLTCKAMSELCVILNDYMLLRDTVTPLEQKEAALEHARLVHLKLMRWADDLPPHVQRGTDCLPVVFDLHFFYHGFIVELFRPFDGTGPEAEPIAIDVMNASIAQMRRLLFVRRHRFGGPTFTSTIAGPLHILMFSLLETLSKSSDPNVDPEDEFHLLVCAEAMRDVGECFPNIAVVLHSLLNNAKKRTIELPEAVEAIFQELDTHLFKRIDFQEVQSQYPIDLDEAMTDPDKSSMESLLKAAYELRINSKRDSSAKV